MLIKVYLLSRTLSRLAMIETPLGDPGRLGEAGRDEPPNEIGRAGTP